MLNLQEMNKKIKELEKRHEDAMLYISFMFLILIFFIITMTITRT
jgi:hypothetical protein